MEDAQILSLAVLMVLGISGFIFLTDTKSGKIVADALTKAAVRWINGVGRKRGIAEVPLGGFEERLETLETEVKALREGQEFLQSLLKDPEKRKTISGQKGR